MNRVKRTEEERRRKGEVEGGCDRGPSGRRGSYGKRGSNGVSERGTPAEPECRQTFFIGIT